MSRIPSAENASMVWSISAKAGTQNATRFFFASASEMISAATRVLPAPVGAISTGRFLPLASEARSRSMAWDW